MYQWNVCGRIITIHNLEVHVPVSTRDNRTLLIQEHFTNWTDARTTPRLRLETWQFRKLLVILWIINQLILCYI